MKVVDMSNIKEKFKKYFCSRTRLGILKERNWTSLKIRDSLCLVKDLIRLSIWVYKRDR